MTRRNPFVRLLARVSLLCAAVLHFGTAAVAPSAHPGSLESWVVGSDAGDPSAPAGREPHDERGCALCHLLGAFALGAPASQLPPPTHGTALEAWEAPSADATAKRSAVSARGPPL